MSKVNVFDVNETLLDLGALDPRFERVFGDGSIRREWFQQLLQSAMVATITGSYSDFGTIGGAALGMTAARRGMELSDEDRGYILAGMRELPPHPEVPAALDRLRDAGIRLAALTNSTEEVANAQLSNAGLADRFETILSADSAKRLKPAPEPYRAAAESLGVGVEDVQAQAAGALGHAAPAQVRAPAAGVGGLLLATLVPESHAFAQGPLPIAAIWLHLVAAALWTGGLLAFPLLLFGPLRALGPDERADLRRRTVRRFSRVATAAVLILVVTGLYSTLLNVSGPLALFGSAYGRALIMKLGMTVLLLATGGINLIDKGDGPLGRMVGLELALAAGIFVAAGFLTSLPPAN